MEFFITWALMLGLVVVPALLNYYLSRWFREPSAGGPSKLEEAGASFVVTIGLLVGVALLVLLISLGWEDLKEQIQSFVQLGLVGYAQDRPVALTGVLTAVSVIDMAVMALLGSFRIPARFVR